MNCKDYFVYSKCHHFLVSSCLHEKESTPGHEIAPDTVNNTPKFTLLATKIQKIVARMATRTRQIPYILLLCTVQFYKAS